MAATLGPSRGLYGYAKAVANSLKVSAGQNSRRIDGYRKYSGHPLQVSGTGGYCQGPTSGGEGGDDPTAEPVAKWIARSVRSAALSRYRFQLVQEDCLGDLWVPIACTAGDH